MSAEAMVVEGRVLTEERGDLYVCECQVGEQTHRVLARRSGRMIVSRVRVVPGDDVTIEVSPFDVRRGRIVYRGPRAAAG